MLQKLEAVYCDGVLRPIEHVDLANNSRVTLIVLSAEDARSGPFPAGVPGRDLERFRGCISAQDAAEMSEAVEEAFEQVDPDDWR